MAFASRPKCPYCYQILFKDLVNGCCPYCGKKIKTKKDKPLHDYRNEHGDLSDNEVELSIFWPQGPFLDPSEMNNSGECLIQINGITGVIKPPYYKYVGIVVEKGQTYTLTLKTKIQGKVIYQFKHSITVDPKSNDISINLKRIHRTIKKLFHSKQIPVFEIDCIDQNIWS